MDFGEPSETLAVMCVSPPADVSMCMYDPSLTTTICCDHHPLYVCDISPVQLTVKQLTDSDLFFCLYSIYIDTHTRINSQCIWSTASQAL